MLVVVVDIFLKNLQNENFALKSLGLKPEFLGGLFAPDMLRGVSWRNCVVFG